MHERIPFQSLAEGIHHGPYPAAPSELVEHYVAARANATYEDSRSDEQFRADIESEWQYDQHCAAVETASENGRITPEHAIFMIDKVLRPWFIGRRNPGE